MDSKLGVEVIPEALAAPMVVAVGALVGGGRHEDGQARDDVSNDFLAVSTGVDYVWSFGIARDHGPA